MRSIFALAFVFAITVGALDAHADIADPAVRRIPLDVTLNVTGPLKDRGLVIVGCNSKEGRHLLTFPEPGKMVTCGVKHPPEVFLAAAKDVAALRQLHAQDVGWGTEGVEARKLLANASACGTISEKTNVDAASKVDRVQAVYTITAREDGCSLVRAAAQASTQPEPSPPPSAPAPAPLPASASSAVPVRDPGAVAPRPGCAGCATTAGTAFSWPWALLLVLGFARRRR